MSVLSKSGFNQIKYYECAEVIHPWSRSCIQGNIQMATSSLIGASKFYALMYSAVILFKMKSKKKIDFKREFTSFLRSVLGVICLTGTFCCGNCILRRMLGKFNYCITIIVLPVISISLLAMLDTQERTNFNTTTFLTGALEGLYSILRYDRNIKRSTFLETLAFMVLNGTLMYFLSTQRKSTQNSWFFMPSKADSSQSKDVQWECTHEGTCKEHLQKDIFKFGGITLILSALKLMAQNLKNPSRAVKLFFQWRNWKLTALVGAYIGISKITNCYLSKTRGNSPLNAFIAGVCGGLSYCINPKVTFLFSVVTALLKVVGTKTKQKYNTPDLPYFQIVLVWSLLCSIYLIIIHEPSCPKYILNILNMITNNKAYGILGNLIKIQEMQVVRK